MTQNLYMEKIGENAVNSLKQISSLNIKKKKFCLKII